MNDAHLTASSFFDPNAGDGDPVWMQHFWWVLGQPQVFLALLAVILAVAILVVIRLSRTIFTDPVSRAYLWLVVGILVVGFLIHTRLVGVARNVALHDTYYVVAHHQFLMGMLIAPILFALAFAALKTRYNRWLGLAQFVTFSGGILALAMPQFLIGLQGMPRRYVDYRETYDIWNGISEVGFILIAVSLLLFVVIMTLALAGRLNNKDRKQT